MRGSLKAIHIIQVYFTKGLYGGGIRARGPVLHVKINLIHQTVKLHRTPVKVKFFFPSVGSAVDE